MTDTPFSLLIKPASAACNLRCRYCFYSGPLAHKKRNVGGRMDDGVLQRLLASYFATEQQIYTFTWQGGEPTLMGLDFFKRVIELQKKLAPAGSTVANALQTNGILLTGEWARFLGETRFLAGLSLDGPEEIHDRYRIDDRGRGTWKRVMNAWELLQHHGVETNILCMVHEGNASRAGELYDFFLDRGMKYQQYIPLVEFDHRGGLYDFSLKGEDWGRFLLNLFARWFPSDVGRISIRNFDSLWALLATGRVQTCVNSPACNAYFVVEARGDVYPCDFFVKNNMLLGNIFETSWKDMRNSGRYRRFAEKKRTSLPGECKTCPWLHICRGGCQKYRVRDSSLLRRGKQHYILCPGERLFLSDVVPRFRRYMEETNPGRHLS